MSDVLGMPDTTTLTRSRLAALVELTKPRIAGMVLVATALGYFLALPTGAGMTAVPLLIHTLLGTLMVGGGANALNHFLEAEHDALMTRTADRPIPSGRLTPREALAFSVTMCVSGVAYLALLANPLAAVLAALAAVSYAFVYTPLKRSTPLCVFVGAVPGALPPLIGWAAASGSLALGGWLLFAIVFFWQLPHFAAIAWLYREDYGRAGYPMMSVVDPEGMRTNLHMITHTATLLVASLLPVVYGLAGPGYAICAMGLGAAFLAVGFIFVVQRTRAVARLHLLASVAYLPLLFLAMLIDRASEG